MEQRYTRKQLEKETGVKATTIYQIETGENDNPKLKTITALAKVLKIPIATLIK